MLSDLIHPPETESLAECLGVTETDPQPYRWLEPCRWCGRKHVMAMALCPACQINDAALPASEQVREQCRRVYRCDGCDAYEGRYDAREGRDAR